MTFLYRQVFLADLRNDLQCTGYPSKLATTERFDLSGISVLAAETSPIIKVVAKGYIRVNCATMQDTIWHRQQLIG